MNPSVNHRLDSMIRAMTDIIIPAIGPSNGLASEQAGLVLGHLHVLRQQADDAARYEKAERDAMAALGQALAAEARGGPQTSAALAMLGPTLADVPVRAPRAQRDAIAEAIEQLIRASRDDGDPVARRRVSALVLQHGHAASALDRSWFSAMRFEPADSVLPDIGTMLAALD